jgi:hypothetical protein
MKNEMKGVTFKPEINKKSKLIQQKAPKKLPIHLR